MTTLVAMATVHETNLNDIFYESMKPILMKFHFQYKCDRYTILS